MEIVEARMPARQRTPKVKSLLFLLGSLVVMFVYLGIPLLLLMHSVVHTLLTGAIVGALVVSAVLAWTLRILRATSPDVRRPPRGRHVRPRERVPLDRMAPRAERVAYARERS